MDIGIAQKRAVVGGTGKYRGIKGEVTTSRNEDGTYEFLFSKQITSICSLNKFSTQKIF